MIPNELSIEDKIKIRRDDLQWKIGLVKQFLKETHSLNEMMLLFFSQDMLSADHYEYYQRIMEDLNTILFSLSMGLKELEKKEIENGKRD